jgi:hypothetical protein
LAKPVHDHRGVSPRRFCSKRCTGAHRTAYAHAEQAGKGAKPAKPARENGVGETAAELINMSLVQPLTSAQSAKVRGYVFGLLRAQIPCAHRVVMGELEWTPTQARVFGMLLDKCLPNLSATFVDSERRNGDLCLMTREELEALAAGFSGREGEESNS